MSLSALVNINKYAGIGSRQTPGEILVFMEKLGEAYAKAGWLLRSGGAEGADAAFEAGCDKGRGKKEIFLPWKKFNKHSSSLFSPSKDAASLASSVHPAWEHCSREAKLLLARNTQQALGVNLDDPVNLIICWTRGETGGTAIAIKIGKKYGIETVNLYDNPFEFYRLMKISNRP